MPVDSHLEWSEMRDFSAGLWDVGNQIMPPNAAQQMVDCYPLPGGGMRAWQKRQSFTTSGVVDTTHERVRALHVNEGLTNRSGSGNGNDYWMLTYNTSDTKCRLYRMDQTAAGPPTTWSLLKTFAAGLDPGNTRFTNYYDVNFNQYVAFSLGFAGSTDAGVWYVDYSTGTPTKLTGKQGGVFNYQSRLCVNLDSKIWFTDPGAFTNIDANDAPVDINEGNNPAITGAATFSPGDLLVFKAAGPIYLVEGDLDNYTVRQMNASKFIGQGGVGAIVKGPNGIIFRALNDGIYETPDGSQLNPLSSSLLATHFPGSSFYTWSTHFLMDQDSGLVYDYNTKAWFTTTMQGGGVGMTMARSNTFFIGDNSGATMTLWTLDVNDGSTHRAESYTWQSAPLRHETGRQIEIRSIEVYARSFNGATSTISVTVDGDTRTIACDSLGRGGITFYFLKYKEELDVTVTAASNASGVEAPVIEVIRVGSMGGHFLMQGADAG